jgi:hypothetical protein
MAVCESEVLINPCLSTMWEYCLFACSGAVRTFILIPREGRILLKVSDDSSGPLGRWFTPPTAQDLDHFLDAALRRAELLDRTS